MRELDLYSGLPPPEPVPPEKEPSADPAVASTDGSARRGSSAGRTAPRSGGERPDDWIQSLWRGFMPAVRERFEPRAVIGEGGMGVVIEAYDRVMERVVAIKGPRDPAGLSSNSRARQLLEAQIAARLAHPNILPVFDLWSDARGNPWCSMLRVPGAEPTLAAYLAGIEGLPVERRPLVQLLRTYLEICRAIAFAHSAGYLHRDIKPENVFLGSTGEALVADWGVATRLDEARAGTRDRVGTRGYAAPEQLGSLGEARADERSDVYSLGVLLYEMLVGRRYARVSSASTSGFPVQGEPPPEGPKIPDLIPRELVAIIQRATAWTPEARHPDVDSLIHEIDAYQTGELLDGLLYGPVARFRKWAQKHPLGAGAVLTGFFASIVVLTMTMGLRRQAMMLHKRMAQVFAEKALNARERADVDRALHYSAMALQTWPAEYVMGDPVPYTVLAENRGRGRHVWSQALSTASTCVAFGPDGRTVAVAGSEGGVKLFDISQGVETRTLLPREGKRAAILSLSFSATGRLATGAADGAVRVYDADGHELPATFVHRAAVRSLAISTDGKLVVSASDDGTVHLLGLDGLKPPIVSLDVPTMGAGSLALDRALEKVFLCAQDGALAMLDVGVRDAAEFDGVEIDRRLVGHIKPVAGGLRHVSYIPTRGSNGEILVAFATASPDLCQQVQLWDLSYWRDAGVLHHDRRVTATCFAPGTRDAAGQGVGHHALAVASEDGVIRVWDVAKRAVKVELSAHDGAVHALAASPDGRLLASVGEDRTLRIHDIQTGWLRYGHPRTGRTPADAVYTPDRKWLLEIERADGRVTTHDAKTRECLGASKARLGAVLLPPAVSASGRRVLLRHATCVTAYDFGGPRGTELIPAESTPVTSAVCALAFTSGGRALVLERSAAGFVVREPGSANVLSELVWPGPPPSSVALALDGKRALLIDALHHPRLWEPGRTGRLTLDIEEFTSVSAAAFAPDGSTLALGNSHGTVMLWERGRHRQVQLDGHHSPVRSLAFSADGLALASLAEEPVIRNWDLSAFANPKAMLKELELTSPYEFDADSMQLVSRKRFRPRPWFPADYTTPAEVPR